MTVKGPIQLRKENAERMASLNDLSPWEKKLREDAAHNRAEQAGKVDEQKMKDMRDAAKNIEGGSGMPR